MDHVEYTLFENCIETAKGVEKGKKTKRKMEIEGQKQYKHLKKKNIM